jgi:hypothetical protein
MPNLRIVSDNAIERATLSAYGTAGDLVVSNLASAQVYPVWRSTLRYTQVMAAFADAETIGFVGFPFCNLSPTAQLRVRLSNEAAITNNHIQTEAFDNAAWTKSAVTVAANVAAAPDGAVSADRIIATTTSGPHYVQQSIGVVALNGLHTESFFAKRDTGERYLRLQFGTGFTNSFADFDLDTGTMIATSNCTARVDARAGGWYRCSITASATSAATSFVQVYTNRSTNGAAYAGNGTAGILLWGAMGVAGPVTGSYYPSANAAATRPTGHIDSWQSYDYDSGLVLACPAPAVRLRGFTPAQAASAYAYGGGAYARHWLPTQVTARGMVVEILDPDNLQGYIEAGCMVASSFWSLTYSAAAGSVTMVDRTEISRSAAGGQLADPGTMSRKVPVDLRAMPPADRATFLNLVRNSRAHPILLSVFAMHADAELERDFMVYGRRTKDSDIAYQFMNAYATTLEVEEI